MKVQFGVAVTTITVAGWLATMPTSAMAITGAQLRASDDDVGHGYVFGVTEAYLRASTNEELRDCMAKSHLTEASLYQAVAAYIDRTPSSLSHHAVDAVTATLQEICP